MVKVEICVNGVTSALAAQSGGAHRVELCENLAAGGTTPSFGTIAVASEKLNIDLMVMIRPRGGDFCYSDEEFEVMQANIKQLHALKVTGVVFGILQPTGHIDMERCQKLIDLARPMKVTFHRAFDMVIEPFKALEDCLELGVDMILTSGQQPQAPMGLDLIRRLNQSAGNRLKVMPGSGITFENAKKVVAETAVSTIHVSSAVQHAISSKMQFKNQILSMGTAHDQAEFHLTYTSAERVRQLVQVVN
ncbi:MAG: copper homeostasis protein CutC [Chloroflexota bacterium]